MKKMLLSFSVIVILVLSLVTGCSKSKLAVSPGLDSSTDKIILSGSDLAQDRHPLAMYKAVVDFKNKSFEIQPVDRQLQYHYPLTETYPNVLRVVEYGFQSHFWAYIQLNHPFPGGNIDAFDPRVVVILPATDQDVYFNYPEMNVKANNYMLENHDGYTRLYDDLAPGYEGNANPFVAYFKDQPDRIWSATGQTQETKIWHIRQHHAVNPLAFYLVVDVSTHYPAPSQPVVDNAPEPVEIEGTIIPELPIDGSPVEIEVALLDWQGADGIGDVLVECPGVFNSTIPLSYFSSDPINKKYFFRGQISNQLSAPEGKYNMLVGASDETSGIWMYEEIEIVINNDIPDNAEQINSPYMISGLSGSFAIQDDMLFTATGGVFDVSDKLNPTPFITHGFRTIPWKITGTSTNVIIDGQYAYVNVHKTITSLAGIRIFDLHPVESIWLAKEFITPGTAWDMAYKNGYCYVADGTSGLQVIDVDPPEATHIARNLAFDGDCREIEIDGSFAYVISYYNGRTYFRIIDIASPENPQEIKTIDSVYSLEYLQVDNGYVFLQNKDVGILVIDVSSPGDAHLHSMLSIETPVNLIIENGKAYCGYGPEGLKIYDVTNPESAYLIGVVNATIGDMHVHDGYVYSSTTYDALKIIDVDPPETAYVTGVYYYCGKGNYGTVVFNDGKYTHTLTDAGYHIFDTDPIEDAIPVAHIYVPYDTGSGDIWADEEYAYVANGRAGLNIIDINPPEDASIIKTITFNLFEDAWAVDVVDKYAYVTTNLGNKLYIINVESPGAAYIVNSIEVESESQSLNIKDGYAYITGGVNLNIVDVDPPENATLINEFALPGLSYPDIAQDVFVYNSISYITAGDAGLFLVDVTDPESAFFIDNVDTGNYAYRVKVQNGYAYVLSPEVISNPGAVQIFDIIPPSNIQPVYSFCYSDGFSDLAIDGDRVFLGHKTDGLIMYQLW